ncbi:MAG: hypothetical protein QM786_19330 [Breznakibacter sp.]
MFAALAAEKQIAIDESEVLFSKSVLGIDTHQRKLVLGEISITGTLGITVFDLNTVKKAEVVYENDSKMGYYPSEIRIVLTDKQGSKDVLPLYNANADGPSNGNRVLEAANRWLEKLRQLMGQA